MTDNLDLESSNVIPPGWEIAPLKKVVSKLVDGSHTPPAKQQRGRPMLSARNIENNQIVLDDFRYIADEDFRREHARTRIAPGDVLLTIVGSIGRSAVVPDGFQDFTLQRSVAVLTPNGLLPKYLMYQLQAPSIQRHFEKAARGTAQKGVYLKTLGETRIRVAPLDQQKQIVAEIEKQFSRLDEAVANLKRVKANLKRYKAAVLKAAVEGKLTQDWRKQHPDVEPASELLKRILAERRAKWEKAELIKMKAAGKEPKDDKWKKRYQEPGTARAEEIYNIPKSWVWANLDQLSWSVKDGPHYSPKYATSGIPFITGGHIRPEGIDFSSAKYISPQLHAELSERCKPEFGDLLYTKGGTTGIARINTDKREFNVWVHVAVLKLVDSIERFYLQHALNSPHCYRQSQRYTHGVGNQDLGLTRMIWITVPLPPVEEQHQIILEIDRRLSIAKAIEEQVDANLSRGIRLWHSILSKAFSGELTAQTRSAQ